MGLLMTYEEFMNEDENFFPLKCRSSIQKEYGWYEIKLSRDSGERKGSREERKKRARNLREKNASSNI